ncbi:MAG: hypothetical protein IJ757_02765 [Clostridiales bacterium]|nr:hypothetical protein [Clostridiales bacterium]
MIEIKCPNCGAFMNIGTINGVAVCEFCGSKIIFDEKAASQDMRLKSRSEAKARDAQIEIERAKELSVLETKKKVINTVLNNPKETLEVADKVASILKKFW